MTRSLRTSILALLQIFAAAAQPARPPATWLDPDRTEPPGAHYGTFSSHLAGGDVSYLVYLPPEYESATERRFPVVYWLHGLGGNQRSGAKFVSLLDSNIRTGRRPPSMIVVLVNGMRDSFYNDSPDGKWPIESVIVKELIPHIDKTYRTIARRQARAIEGYSMGGYGAAHIGFKYPDLFGIVGVMAGALITPRDSVQPAVFQKMFGSDPAYVQANDPFALARRNADSIRGKTAVRIAVGDQDSLQVRNQALHELLVQLKIEHEYEVVPGVAHNGSLFYDTLGERAFAWYRKALASQAPSPEPVANASAPSHVFKRGEVEILTYETEQDYDRLQELFEPCRKSTATPGVMTTRYYRSNLEHGWLGAALRAPSPPRLHP
jgi:enterochelin esterase-like enzyme